MQHKVIIADDAKFMRAMLRDILEDLGFDVVAEAPDGRQAVQRYLELAPDLIMLDISMPEMSGLEACRTILQHDPSARVIMVSALGQRDEVLASIRSGAEDFVIKPFDVERVEEVVHKLLARHAVTC